MAAFLMPDPTTPIFFHRSAFEASVQQVFEALDGDRSWIQELGGTFLDSEPGSRIRARHAGSSGILEAAIALRKRR